MMNPRPPRRWLVLPIESNVRELDSKTLLAAVAAERGHGAILLRLADFGRVVPRLPPAVVLQKDIIGSQLINSAKAAGHVVVALDEEGLVQRDPDDYLHRRVSVPALAGCARFLAWGDMHRETLLRKAPEYAHRIIPTGNPRFDLLRPELRGLYQDAAERLIKRYGQFVMINSNFGTANHRLGEGYIRQHWASGGWSEGVGREQLLKRILTFQSALLTDFALTVEALAEELRGECAVIVRPHPSENHQTWRDHLSHIPNVAVFHEGPVLSWLLASRALIHNSCTTGIEATLLDRPTFAYMPVRDQAAESSLPNGVSIQVESRDDLLAAVAGTVRCAAAPRQPTTGRELLAHHVASLEGPLAADAILDQVEQVAPQPAPLQSAGLPLQLRLGRASVQMRSYAAAARTRSFDAQRRYNALLHQTSPGLDMMMVREVVTGLREASGRFGSVSCTQLAPDVVAVGSCQ
jgi:surface carbohydrate biosynthesis protein